MAENSGFFNSYEGDRKYYISDIAKYFSTLVGNGVFFGGSYLKIEPVGGNMDIMVKQGKGWINGYYYVNKDAPKVMTVPKADLTRARIDIVVLRLDLTDPVRAIHTVVKAGEPALIPVAPQLQRDDAIWELKLAEIRVNANVKQIYEANITDYRLNSEQCGIVMSLVPNDFTFDQIFNQYKSELAHRIQDWETQIFEQSKEFNVRKTEMDAWFAEIRATLYDEIDFNFDNNARRVGHTLTIEHEATPQNKYTETIRNTNSGNVYATRISVVDEDTFTETTICDSLAINTKVVYTKDTNGNWKGVIASA